MHCILSNHLQRVELHVRKNDFRRYIKLYFQNTNQKKKQFLSFIINHPLSQILVNCMKNNKSARSLEMNKKNLTLLCSKLQENLF